MENAEDKNKNIEDTKEKSGSTNGDENRMR